MKVREWMSPDPVTVTPVTTVREAQRLLRYYGVRHLPVVSHRRAVGIISDSDVRGDAGADVLVADVMSAPVHRVGPEDEVEAAARLMLSRHISALPVIDGDGELVGVITTTDCLLASLTPQPA